MGLFSKKSAKDSVPLPVIPAHAIGKIEVQAARLARIGLAVKAIVESVPGLTEYGVKVLVPQLTVPLITQNWEKAIAIVAGDVVVGGAVVAAFESARHIIKSHTQGATNV